MDRYVRECSYNPYDESRINYQVQNRDRIILRDLAKRVHEMSQDPIMADRKKLWKAHNGLKTTCPLFLIFPEGSWRELLPVSVLTCTDMNARTIEWELRKRIYMYEQIDDDSVVENNWMVTKTISDTGWGLAPKRIALVDDEKIGRMTTAYRYEPVIMAPADLKKLEYPEVVYDEKDSLQRYHDCQELFGDILDVELRGTGQISLCYTPLYTKLRGLTQVMMDMYEEPAMLHDAMSFMREGYKKLIAQYVELNLLSLNNDNTYHSSGGIGFTDELPQEGFDPANVRTTDIWASAQSQEMSEVSPEMHYEFIMRYEMETLRDFGLNGYGCCDNLTRKLEYVFQIPNLRRISISPWADVEKCADLLKDKYIFSWKPNPSYLAHDHFDGEFVKKDIQHTLNAARECVLEIILKDTHTCRNEPQRFTQWSKIVRELVNQEVSR
jgi:hypothetical protein